LKYFYHFFTNRPQQKWKSQISHWRSATQAIYGNIWQYSTVFTLFFVGNLFERK